MTVPGIGAVNALSPPGRWSCTAASTSGSGVGAGGGRFSRQAPCHGRSGCTSGARESGG